MALPGVRLLPESRPKLQRPSCRLSVPSKSPPRSPRNAPPWAVFKPGHHSSEVALVPALLCDGRPPSQGCSGSRPDNQVFVRRRGPPRSRAGTRVTCREQALWQRRPAGAAVAQRRLPRDARLRRPRRSAHRCAGRGRLGVAGWRRWGCGPNHAWAQHAGRLAAGTRLRGLGRERGPGRTRRLAGRRACAAGSASAAFLEGATARRGHALPVERNPPGDPPR